MLFTTQENTLAMAHWRMGAPLKKAAAMTRLAVPRETWDPCALSLTCRRLHILAGDPTLLNHVVEWRCVARHATGLL